MKGSIDYMIEYNFDHKILTKKVNFLFNGDSNFCSSDLSRD